MLSQEEEHPRESSHSTRTSRKLMRGYRFFFLFRACVNADPATLLTFFGAPFLRRSWAAFFATRFDVYSFLAMVVTPG